MRVLFLVAHPNFGKSFNHQVTYSVAKHLETSKHETKIIDLYEEFHDFVDETDPEKLKEFTEKILWSDICFFQFPLYWFGCPAVMLCFFKNVFPIVAEDNEKRKRKCVISTTTGAIYTQTAINRKLLHLTRTCSRLGKFSVQDNFLAFSIGGASKDKRDATVKRCGEYLDVLTSGKSKEK